MQHSWASPKSCAIQAINSCCLARHQIKCSPCTSLAEPMGKLPRSPCHVSGGSMLSTMVVDLYFLCLRQKSHLILRSWGHLLHLKIITPTWTPHGSPPHLPAQCHATLPTSSYHSTYRLNTASKIPRSRHAASAIVQASSACPPPTRGR